MVNTDFAFKTRTFDGRCQRFHKKMLSRHVGVFVETKQNQDGIVAINILCAC